MSLVASTMTTMSGVDAIDIKVGCSSSSNNNNNNTNNNNNNNSYALVM